MTVQEIAELAGVSAGKISNVLVGGQIFLNCEVSGQKIQGHVGGIVGYATESIETVATLGFDIEDKTESNKLFIAGIAGKADAKITDARFVSAGVKFEFNSGYCLGHLIGYGTVAGISASGDGSIEFSTVESFIDKLNNDIQYSLQGNNIYGLTAGAGAVSNSFVSANLMGSNVYLTSNSSETNTYFIGRVKIVDESKSSSTIKKSTYSVIYNDEDFTYFGGAEATDVNLNKASFEENSWEQLFSGLTGFEINKDFNRISVLNYANSKFFFPYIERNGESLMIIAPTSIDAALNNGYSINTEKNIYVDDYNDVKYEISEAIIVDFFKNKYSNDNPLNTHNLINSENQKGLIDLSILPTNSSSGLKFEIVGDGSDFAYITLDNKIVFTGVSNGNAIIVKCYSIFNHEEVVYVAFYTQYTFTKLTLNSSNMVDLGDDNFELNVYTGQAGDIISFGAENKINGNDYTTIFNNSNLAQYLYVEVEQQADSKLEVVANTWSNISISIAEGMEVLNDEIEMLKFKLYLEPECIGSDKVTANIFIGEVNLKLQTLLQFQVQISLSLQPIQNLI